MQSIRRSQERGFADHGWLKSFHSFSFAEYYDPKYLGFGPLRVINEDRVQPGAGFGTHGHRDMEIISYVLEGALAHKDSLGNGSTIRPGDVQRMSAGTGIRHSEFNASPSELVHFLQIWIQPGPVGIPPSYEERHFDAADLNGTLRLIASPDRSAGSVLIHQDVRVYAGRFEGEQHAELEVAAGRRLYAHVARGSAAINAVALQTGDALLLTDTQALQVHRGTAAELLVFDLPA
jgi:redox-sensitive bicupin YhaK (pirin superfamily)